MSAIEKLKRAASVMQYAEAATSEIGALIRAARTEAGMSQAELCQRLGVANQSYVSAYEQGRRIPTAETLEKFCRALERRLTSRGKRGTP